MTNYGPGDYETMGASARAVIDGTDELLYESYLDFVALFEVEEPGAVVMGFEEWRSIKCD